MAVGGSGPVGLGVWWADVPLGAGCLLAGLHQARRVARPAWASGVAFALMGLGMAAMFVPPVDPLPRPVWVAVFLGTGAWSAVAALRGGRSAGAGCTDARHHLAGAAAMLFMLLAAPSATGAGMAHEMAHDTDHGMAMARPGLPTGVLALVLAAWFLADVARVITRAPVPAGPGGVAVRTDRGTTTACLVMSAGMAVMLVLMV